MIIASIDIGTNTVLLLIAEVNENNNIINPIKNEYRIPRIGKGLKSGDKFPEENIERLFSVLTEYKKEIDNYNCKIVLANATNAFRMASDSNDIIKEIKNKFNIAVKVIKGDEEAIISFEGIANDYSGNEKIMVIDIGGGSTEIIFGRNKTLDFVRSFPAGAVMGTEKYFKNDPPLKSEIDDFKKWTRKVFNELSHKLLPKKGIAVAGTPTTLACLKHDLDEFDEEEIEGSILTKEEIIKFAEEFSQLTINEIKEKYKNVVKGREDVILAGTLILADLLEMNNLNEVIVSTKGLRFGAIADYLNKIKD